MVWISYVFPKVLVPSLLLGDSEIFRRKSLMAGNKIPAGKVVLGFHSFLSQLPGCYEESSWLLPHTLYHDALLHHQDNGIKQL